MFIVTEVQCHRTEIVAVPMQVLEHMHRDTVVANETSTGDP